MELVVAVAFMVVPPVMVVALRKTRLWQVPGLIVAAFGVYAVTKLDLGAAGAGGLYSLVEAGLGVIFLAYAAILLVVARSLHRSATRKQQPGLPRAQARS